MPRRAAVVVLGVSGLGVLVGGYLMLRSPSSAPKAPRQSTPRAADLGPRDPAPRPAEVLTRVAYLPSMDLDTFSGYLKAAKAHATRAKTDPSPSLRAAQAKTLFFAAFRYASTDQQKKARKLMKKIVEEEGGEALKARALERLLSGKPKAARSLLKRAAALDEKDPEVPLLEGWLAFETGRITVAERAFRRALTLRSKSAGARYGLAMTLGLKDAAGTLEERKTLLGEALTHSPLHAQALVAQLELVPPADSTDAEKKLTALLGKLGEEASPRERSALARGSARLALGEGALDKALTMLANATRAPGAEPALLHLDGVTRLQVGDLRTATTRLEEALKAEPVNLRLLEALVRAYLGQGQVSKATEAVDHLLAHRVGSSTPTPRLAPRDGAAEPEAPADRPRRRRPAAEPPTRTEPATEPPARTAGGLPAKGSPPTPGALADPWLDLIRGRIEQARGEHEEARRFYLSSTSRHSDFTEGHAAYLSLLHEQRQYEGMKAVLELVRARFGENLPAPLVILEGQMLLGLGKIEAAAKVLRAGSEREPASNALLLELARCLWRHQKKPEEAYLLLDQVAKRASALLSGVRLLADFHWERKERDRARQRFEEARKILRFDALDRAFAELLLRLPTPANLKQAKELLEPLLQEANHRDGQALALYALVALGEGDAKEAAKRIRRALSINPKVRKHRIIEARIVADSGDARQAILLYDALLKEQPSDLVVLMGRARLFCRYRDTKRCIASAQDLIKRQADPEAHLLEGQGYLQDRNPARAMRSFRQAIALDRSLAEAHFQLGRTLYDETNYRAAIGSLRQSLDLSEETLSWWPDIHYFLGMSYVQVKSGRLASTHLKRYLATAGNRENPETGAQRRAAEEALKRLGN